MHEFNACQTIVDSVIAEMGRAAPGARLLSAQVAIGGLSQIEPEFMRTAYERLTRQTIAQGSRLAVRRLPLRGRCSKCQWEGDLPGRSFCCAACKSTVGTLIGGREAYLENLEIEP
jgi:hydrogenase nickel incorporation protein HypA/HybF